MRRSIVAALIRAKAQQANRSLSEVEKKAVARAERVAAKLKPRRVLP